MKNDEKPFMERILVEASFEGSSLDDPEWVEGILNELVEYFDYTLMGTTVHSFEPVGITGVAVVGESHISLHTWPEQGYLHLEILSCKDIEDMVSEKFFKDILDTEELEMDIGGR